MMRGVLYSVALCGLLIYVVFELQSIYERSLPERVVRIDVYADRIAYRTSSYATPSLLAIGIKAAREAPRKLVLHDCARMGDFETVIGIVREQGHRSFDVELPEDC